MEKNFSETKNEKIFAGKTFVITGVFENYSRDALKKKIKQAGGKVTESGSKQTTYLVAGASPGPKKLDEAKKMAVRIISEGELEQLL